VARIVVAGSINLDLAARVRQLPAAGTTVAASGLERVPGGKGANQALAAARLGADVTLVGAVGEDVAAREALLLLRAAGVDLDGVRVAAGLPTGHALITVDDAGETTIVVAAGANAALTVEPHDLAGADAVLTVLEVPDAAVAAATCTSAFVVLTAAPPRPLSPEVLERVALVVVNRSEYQALGGVAGARAVAVTSGAAGAVLLRGGREVACAQPPAVQVVDGTAAGDAFTAALTIALLDGLPDRAALRFACAAGAAAVTRAGAQPSLPTVEQVRALCSR